MRVGEQLGDFPVLVAVGRLHHLAHRLDAALGVGEGAVLLEEGRARQEHVRVVGGLVEEQVVDDHAVHRREPGGDVLGVGVGLEDVLALDVDRLERAIDRGVEHVGDAQARLGVERDAPVLLEQRARRAVGDVAIAGQLVREASPCRRRPGRCSARAAGSRPTPGPADVAGAIARLAIAITVDEPWLCSVTPRP